MIRAIAPWYGSKRILAPTIVAELGPHNSFWDVMCGSMAVLFAKEPSAHEHANDLHGELINLARVLREKGLAEELYERCARTLFHQDLFAESQQMLDGEQAEDDPYTNPDLERAYHFMVMSWMGRNGIAGTKRVNNTFAVRWTPGGGSGAVRWSAAVDSIPAWHKRLRRVTIIRRDVFTVAESIEDCPGTAIYADPPYLLSSRTGRGHYEHEFTARDHRRLAESLNRFRQARVVVSYYNDPALEELYRPPKWLKRTLKANKQLHVQNQRGAQRAIAPEVLLINGPSHEDRTPGMLF